MTRYCQATLFFAPPRRQGAEKRTRVSGARRERVAPLGLRPPDARISAASRASQLAHPAPVHRPDGMAVVGIRPAAQTDALVASLRGI